MSASRVEQMKGSSAGKTGMPPAAASAVLFLPDPRDWHMIYSNNEGFLTHYDKNTERSYDISVWPNDHSGHGADDLPHRFQWVSPLLPFAAQSRRDLHRRRSGFQINRSRQKLEPDQPGPDAQRQEQTATERRSAHQRHHKRWNITTRSLRWRNRRCKKECFGPGSDDGLVHVSTDDGAHWAKVTPQMPEWSTCKLD